VTSSARVVGGDDSTDTTEVLPTPATDSQATPVRNTTTVVGFGQAPRDQSPVVMDTSKKTSKDTSKLDSYAFRGNSKYLGKLRTNDALVSYIIRKKTGELNFTVPRICQLTKTNESKYHEFRAMLEAVGAIPEQYRYTQQK
jgi:hypothetical protein